MINWAIEYYKKRMSSSDQISYDIIKRSWNNYKTNTIIPNRKMSASNMSQIIEAIAKDHPELFWVDYYSFKIMRTLISTELISRNFFSNNEIIHYKNEADAWVNRIKHKVPTNFSVYDKIWVLYDYLARQVSYGKQNDAFSHTILGPMSKHNHISVCEGIAKSFKYLCDGLDIPCIIVFGDVDFGPGHRGSHAWNIISVDSFMRHIDVTKELQSAHREGKATRINFLSTDKEMGIYTWNRNETPKCI